VKSFFDLNYEDNAKKNAPLDERIRPKNLDKFVGQEAIIGKGKQLNRMITADKIRSIILYGPPGSGKTTIANIIASNTESEFVRLNAVTSGVKDIKNEVDEAKKRLGINGKRTILFIDEIHRFNKAQQDALLPFVENGTLTLIGATTENPFFEVNAALISRSTIFQLDTLSVDDIRKIVLDCLSDEEVGLGKELITLTEEGLDFLCLAANGDARVALNALELAFLTTPRDSEGRVFIDEAVSRECIQKKVVRYDKSADAHYDTISAFIKSLRGSDPDAALYWLAKMLYAGEDPKFIARRMVIFASEDISNADPTALTLAVSTFKAVEVIGLPECELNLAHCVTFLACSPKSNASMLGLLAAKKDIKDKPTAPVPLHLRSTGHSANTTFGNGVGYKYPHDFEKHHVKQSYLPEGFKKSTERYYVPGEIGYEKRLSAYLDWIHQKSPPYE
jgi:putative ATPase